MRIVGLSGTPHTTGGNADRVVARGRVPIHCRGDIA
jgi:hypothetical protein